MTKKLGIKKTGIIATCLAVLLLAGTSMAVYATVTRPSPEISVETQEDGTVHFRVDSSDDSPVVAIVTQDGEKLTGYSVECLPEYWQTRIGEGQSFRAFTDEYGNIVTDNPEAFIITENSIIVR